MQPGHGYSYPFGLENSLYVWPTPLDVYSILQLKWINRTGFLQRQTVSAQISIRATKYVDILPYQNTTRIFWHQKNRISLPNTSSLTNKDFLASAYPYLVVHTKSFCYIFLRQTGGT